MVDQQPVAVGVAEEVVHDLEAVEVEDEHRRRRACAAQPVLQLAQQGPAVGQPGQVVVEGVVLGPLLGVDARLELDEHRGDGLEGVDLRRLPGVQPEVEEAEDAPGRVGRAAAGHGAAHDERHAGPLLNALEVLVVASSGPAGRARAGPSSP